MSCVSLTADIFDTALREATEEMGRLPAFPKPPPANAFTVVRGKKGGKHYTVFVCELTAASAGAFRPRLNKEHSAWRWFPAAAVAGSSSRALQTGRGIQEPLALHPVVDAYFGPLGGWALFARSLQDRFAGSVAPTAR